MNPPTMSFAARMKASQQNRAPAPPQRTFKRGDPARQRGPPRTMAQPPSRNQQQRPPQRKHVQQAPPQARRPQPAPQVQRQGPNVQQQLAEQWEGEGQMIVKIRKISSGDTIICETRQQEVIAVTLNGIQAPRIARSERGTEEFYAFEAREFLRKKWVGRYGRVVAHEEKETNNANRREDDPKPYWGRIMVAQTDKFDASTEWYDLSRLIVQSGFAIVKDNVFSAKDQTPAQLEYFQDLRQMQQLAVSKNLGKHSTANPEEHFRLIDRPNVEQFFAQWKGKKIPAVVDEVREGSTIRLEMNMHAVQEMKGFKTCLVFIHMAGIQSETMPKPITIQKREFENRNPAGEFTSEMILRPTEGAKRAKNITIKRLLHQDVEVRLDFCVSGRLYGTVFFHKGDIAQFLLMEGMAHIVDWHLTKDKEAPYHESENAARAKNKGVWSSGGSGPGKKQIAMEKTQVTQVRSGDSVILHKDGKDEIYYLASIRCPRARNPRNEASSDEPWFFESKEFVRNALIGNDIKVKHEYNRPAPSRGDGRQITLHYISILYRENGVEKNISEELVKHGLAELIQHRRDDARAFNYAHLHVVQESAKSSGTGKWTSAKYSAPEIIDYSDRKRGGGDEELFALRGKAVGFLQECGVEIDTRKRAPKKEVKDRTMSREFRGVVDYCVQATKLKITLIDEKPMRKIFLFLSGIKGYDKDPDHREISDEANKLVKSLVQQKDVWVCLEGVDTWANFLGVVWTHDKQNLAQKLLQLGYAEVFPPSAERSSFEAMLKEAEQGAKEAKAGRWKNWEPEPEPVEIMPTTEDVQRMQGGGQNAERKAVAQLPQNHPWEGTTQQGLITHIENGTSFFVNLSTEEAQNDLEKIAEVMSKISPQTVDIPDDWNIDVNQRPVVAALFGDGNYYRFRVMNYHKTKGTYRGLFIDFGNTEWLKEEQLLPLSEEAASIRPQAYKCTLACLKPPLEKSTYYNSAGELLQNMAYDQVLDLTFSKVLSEYRGNFEAWNRRSRISLFEVVATVEGDDQEHCLNTEVMRLGYGRVDKKKMPFYEDDKGKAYIASLKAADKEAQTNNFGMYEYGIGAMDSDDEDDKKGRFGGRRR